MLPGAMFPPDNSKSTSSAILEVSSTNLVTKFLISSAMCYTLLAGAAVLTAMVRYLKNGAFYSVRQLEQHVALIYAATSLVSTYLLSLLALTPVRLAVHLSPACLRRC